MEIVTQVLEGVLEHRDNRLDFARVRGFSYSQERESIEWLPRTTKTALKACASTGIRKRTMTGEDVTKALEVWTLQNLLNVSIMMGILATGLALIQGYYRSLEKHLSLRVSIELWRLWVVLMVDLLLALVVLFGYLVLNPDIMVDIKMAIPFCPIATVLYAIALVLRLFHGGHAVGSKNYFRAIYFMLLASAVNVAGFTFVMEAPGHEYLELHPSPFWDYLRANLRSNAMPAGVELSQTTFYACFALLAVVFVWGAASALGQIKKAE